MNTETSHSNKVYQALKDKLLEIAGEAVILGAEEDADNILQRGELRNGTDADQVDGLHNQCHANASDYFLNCGFAIATGYALSEDGAWRQHSWNVDQNGKLLESTARRTAYFGYVLNEEEAVIFAEDNPFHQVFVSIADDDLDDGPEMLLVISPSAPSVVCSVDHIEISIPIAAIELLLGRSIYLVENVDGNPLLWGTMVVFEQSQENDVVFLEGEPVLFEDAIEVGKLLTKDQLQSASYRPEAIDGAVMTDLNGLIDQFYNNKSSSNL